MYILQIEEEGAATREHEERPDVAPGILYNIFCAGCQGDFLRRDFFGRDFFRGDFFGLAFSGDFFGADSEGGGNARAT